MTTNILSEVVIGRSETFNTQNSDLVLKLQRSGISIVDEKSPSHFLLTEDGNLIQSLERSNQISLDLTKHGEVVESIGAFSEALSHNLPKLLMDKSDKVFSELDKISSSFSDKNGHGDLLFSYFRGKFSLVDLSDDFVNGCIRINDLLNDDFNLSICYVEDIRSLSLEFLLQESVLLPLDDSGDDVLIISPLTGLWSQQEFLGLTLLSEVLYGDNDESDNECHLDALEEAVQLISYPLALLSNDGDLVLYNQKYSKLSLFPKDCLNLFDGESLEIKGKMYKVDKRELSISDKSYQCFIFLGDTDSDKENRVQSSKELGIISSSIAHELNNPLAGILAALTLLEIEEDWEEDSLSTIADMKKGATRCKELVEIFLGFSKTSMQTDEGKSLESSISQSLDLLRFRMIESNIRMDFDFVEQEFLDGKVNHSVTAMLFYLLFNEFMTAFAHYKLLDDEAGHSVEGKIVVMNGRIEIILKKEFEWMANITDNKLITYLFNLMNLKAKAENHCLVLEKV